MTAKTTKKTAGQAGRRNVTVTWARLLAATSLLVACSSVACSPGGGGSGRAAGPSDPAAPAPSAPEAEIPNGLLPRGSSGSLALARDGELVGCQGWGYADVDRQVEAGCDTAYDVMSMTKQFTAAAVLRLEMDGALAVTDRIGRYFPEVPADKRAITVRHLLTHTSGLPEGLGDDYQPLSRDDLVAAAFDASLRSEPGHTYHYSNTGYSLLAAIIEVASGEDYERYLADHLFAPAGMEHTGYVLPQWSAGQVAVEYDASGAAQGRPFEHPWADDGPYWNLRGNGGILSTAHDLYRWHHALESGLVLDADATAQLFEPRVPEERGGDAFYAYGWVVQDTSLGPARWHNGGNGWSYGEITLLPDDGLMTFWVTNRAVGDGWNLDRGGATITRGLVESLLDEDGENGPS